MATSKSYFRLFPWLPELSSMPSHMELPTLLRADERELAAFNLAERELWVDGSPCQVPECAGTVFKTFRAYIRHYKAVHCPTVMATKCRECRRTFVESARATRHQKHFHQGHGLLDRVAEPNPRYIPTSLPPKRLGMKEEREGLREATKELRKEEAMRQRQELATHTGTSAILLPPNAVSRDECIVPCGEVMLRALRPLTTRGHDVFSVEPVPEY
ncbi:MAG: hypothetical protein ABW185_04600 [Sedimenticola sp.]